MATFKKCLRCQVGFQAFGLISIIIASFGAAQAETIISEATSSQSVVKPSDVAPAFETIGKVSGIEVVTWKTPPQVEVDPVVQTLLDEGAAAFKQRLVAELTAQDHSDRAHLTQRIQDPHYLLQLSRYQLVRSVGVEALDQVLGRREGKDFLTHFLTSQDWLDDFLVAGPFGTTQEQRLAPLHALCTLYRYDKECTIPVYRKLACAYARNKTGNWQDDLFHYQLVDRFQGQKRVHKAGRMHGSFDKMESWEMRYVTVTPRMGDSRALQYMADQLHYPRNNYYGACWSIPYRMGNPFGDSIHRAHYYRPWMNEYFGEPLKHKVGGVCGTLSNYAVGLARAHGIPAFPVGQPGHCAYMIRDANEFWGTAYSVTGNTGAWSYFGGGDESIVRLMQVVYDNRQRKQLLKSYRYDWQANFFQDQQAVVLDDLQLRLYSDADTRKLPDFETLTPVSTLTPSSPEIAPHIQKLQGWAGAVLEATFELPTDQSVHFAIASDDGSRLLIDGEVVVDNDGLHGVVKKEATVQLAAGKHQLRLEYFDHRVSKPVCDLTMNYEPGATEKLARELSIEALPLHLNHWKWYAERMAIDAQQNHVWWKDFSKRFVKTFGHWQRPCWEFLTREVLPQVKAMPVEDRLPLISAWHQAMPLTGKVHHIGGRLTTHINAQADVLETPEQRIGLFRGLLEHYLGSNYLSTVINWGSQTYGKKPETTALFLKELESFASGRSGEVKGVAHILGKIVVDAEQRGDVATVVSTCELAERLCRDQFNRIYHVSEGQLKQAPQSETQFPGKLLSSRGLLVLERPADHFTPLGHHAALQPDRVGFVITNKQAGAKITLKLPGKCRLSGLSIMPRFEQNNRWAKEQALPLTVLGSVDGKEWKPLFETDEVKSLYEIDLQEQAPEVVYLRFQRTDPSLVGHLALRSIRVYGESLY